MKCKSCGSEWKTQNDKNIATSPFCGASLVSQIDENNENGIKEILRWIVQDRGQDVFLNSSIVNAILSDLAHNDEKGRRRINLALSAGAGKDFLDFLKQCNNNPNVDQVIMFEKKLMSNGFAEDFCTYISNCFLYAVSIDIVREITIKDDTKKPVLDNAGIGHPSIKDDSKRADNIEPVEKKTSSENKYSVRLVHVGSNKVKAIRVLRELTGLELKEVMDMLNVEPNVLLKDVRKTDADNFCKKMVNEAPGIILEVNIVNSDTVVKKYHSDKAYDRSDGTESILQKCSSRYAYHDLMSQPNGKNMASYYQAVIRSFVKYFSQEDNIDIPLNIDGRNYWYKDFFDCKRYSVSFEEAKKATIAAFYDHPLAYFAYTYTIVGNIERMLSLYAVDEIFRLGSSRKKYSKLIEDEIMRIVQAVPSSCSGQDAAQAVYDLICSEGKYDHKMGNCGYIDVYAHSVASYAEKHMAVCEGLAKTFQAVMLCLGYECLTVGGYVYNAPDSHSDRHAWNMIKIDNSWRVVDVTAGINGYKPVFKNNPEIYREYEDGDKPYDQFRYQFRHPKAV